MDQVILKVEEFSVAFYIDSFVRTSALHSSLQGEKEWLQGGGTFSASWHQLLSLSLLFAQGTACLSSLKSRNVIPFGSKFFSNSIFQWGIQLSPLALSAGMILIPRDQYPRIHSIGNALSYNIGNIAKSLYFVVSLSALLTHPALFVSSCAGYLVTAYVLDSPKIPDHIREKLKMVIDLFAYAVLGVGSQSMVEKVMYSTLLVINLLEKGLFLIGVKSPMKYLDNLIFGRFDTECLEDDTIAFENCRNTKTALNLKYLQRTQKEHIDLDKDEIKEMFSALESGIQSIDFTIEEAFIADVLQTDDHFTDPSWTDQAIKDERKVDFVIEGMSIFFYRLKQACNLYRKFNESIEKPVLSVRKSPINDLNIISLKYLEHFLDWLNCCYKRILEFEKNDPKEAIARKRQLLIHLGVYGGNYCFTRFIDLSTTCKDFADKRQSCPLDESLFDLLRSKQENLLDNYRIKLWEIMQNRVPTNFLALTYGEDRTTHQNNVFRIMIGEPIGLNVDRAFQDPTVNYFLIWTNRLNWISFIRDFNRRFHQKDFTEKKIIKWIQKDLLEETPKINCLALTNWLDANIPKFLHSSVYKDGISDDAIKYCLVRHGVLGICKD